MMVSVKCLVLAAISSLWLVQRASAQDEAWLNMTKPPDFIHICYKDDPLFSDCIVKTMNGIAKRTADGIPEFGITSIEPVVIDEFEAFEVAGFRLKVKNISAFGGSNFTILSARVSLETGRFRFICRIERLLFTGLYDLARTNASSSPLRLSGRADATSNVWLFIDSQTRLAKKFGVDYLTIVSVNLRVAVGRATGTVWAGGRSLDVISSVLSSPSNSRRIIKAITADVEGTLAALAFKYSNRVFGSVPYDVLIPDTGTWL